MTQALMLQIASLAIFFLLLVAWCWRYGWWRGTLATLCRLLWLVPIFSAFFPRSITEESPSSAAVKPIHILLDDSQSMKTVKSGDEARLENAESKIEDIKRLCVRWGCLARVTRLSEWDGDVKQGLTPLSRVLPNWLARVGSDPWILFSDGGDFNPQTPWDERLRGSGLPIGKGATLARGLIAAYKDTTRQNVWIRDVEISPFSFEAKPLEVGVTLGREIAANDARRVQVQVLSGSEVIATSNAEFADQELTASLSLVAPSLPRGTQLVRIRALPFGEERFTWDNEVFKQVEVLPNTVGVLHLLGAPGWDGRFVRRYLKAEPKYDLISFYILRDPWDSQQVNEREMSLIPFPVERLFRDELPNFRVCIIQNFSLSQFLLPEYQENLVRFVQEGGGLLFIGGSRSLRASDLVSSPLRSILPFDPGVAEADESFGGGPFGFDSDENEADTRGGTYDSKAKFQIELAQPTAEQRALANVYDDWSSLAADFRAMGTLQGMHKTERFRIKSKEATVLLNAKDTAGHTRPLALASYPGKGRALWIFSDAFWKMATSLDSGLPRDSYRRFMESSMTWLLRQDIRKPLIGRDFVVTPGRSEAGQWSVHLRGPAARFVEASADPAKTWKLSVCGADVPLGRALIERTSSDEMILSGAMPTRPAGGQQCGLLLEGHHPAFGSLRVAMATVVPRFFGDDEMTEAHLKLEQLAELTGAKLQLANVFETGTMEEWIATNMHRDVPLPAGKLTTKVDHFWILRSAWIWLFLLFLPIEVLVRRKTQLFGK